MNAVNAMGLEPNEAQSIISQLTFWKQKIEDEIARSRTPGIRPYQKIMEKFQRRMERRALVFKAAENWKDDREPNSDSDADSIFSDSASTASNESANTTASGATPNEEDEQEQTIYTLKDLEKVIRFIAMRCTVDEWQTIFSEANLNTGEFPRSYMNELTYLSLGDCPNARKRHDMTARLTHNFEEKQRCIRCRNQLCKFCQKCVLSRLCKPAIPSVSYDRKDTLAARRIIPNCSVERELRWRRKLCKCTEYIMNPSHSCQFDGGHLCQACFEDADDLLMVDNIKVKQEKGDKEVAEYACDCGAAASPSLPMYCKICRKSCKPFALEETGYTKEDLGKLDINAGICPWILNSPPSDG
ncbi:hypothetical protein V8E51_010101 [Hyaloscypha variabilis]